MTGRKPLFKRILRLTNYSNPNDSVLAASNAKRLGVDQEQTRWPPDDANSKAVDVDCVTFRTLDPKKKSTYFGDFTHSWHIGIVFLRGNLAMTIEGAVDRKAIPTRVLATATCR